MAKKKQFIIELDEFDGQFGAIYPRHGIKSFFCVGEDDYGVIKLVDYGYPTLSQLYESWPELRPEFLKPLKEQGDYVEPETTDHG